jgi:hypothetical protein
MHEPVIKRKLRQYRDASLQPISAAEGQAAALKKKVHGRFGPIVAVASKIN